MRRALVVQGGWSGHEPGPVSVIFERALKELGFVVTVSDTLDAFLQPDLSSLDLIVPIWTMGTITGAQCGAVTAAVEKGTGIAGCHGGMCDSFRENTEWQFMTGGQWVAHPGNDSVSYTVNVISGSSPIVDAISDFPITSEQYYLHVDPAVKVLATTRFPTADGPHAPNGAVDMPVVWTKYWGSGRVFYCSLGHRASMLELEPVFTIMKRGFDWASRGR